MLNEDDINKATAISGSGLHIFLMTLLLIKSAEELGFI